MGAKKNKEKEYLVVNAVKDLICYGTIDQINKELSNLYDLPDDVNGWKIAELGDFKPLLIEPSKIVAPK